EVFDTRWSHCHQWAGCPTWQLSRYALGLQPRFDIAPDHYKFNLLPGRLEEASGAIPTPDGGTIAVRWHRVDKNQINCEIDCPHPLSLELPTPGGLRTMQIEGVTTMVLHPSKDGGWVFTSAAMALRKDPTNPDALTLPKSDTTKPRLEEGS
ncbi:MAG: hypothetical protein NTZ09_03560, partial [Candidatus Hydrogenedentes bacterium]|nr:hypothetical protein [Candidatus Hydrogenedentota bacterium]